MSKWLIIFVGILLPITAVDAQTCCSGGVPLSSNLGLPATNKGAIQLALTYDLNVLETLKSGNRTLEDNSRSRRTHSGIFEVGYGISERFSVDGFFSFVRQEREIRQFGNTNFVATNGIGDAVILLKYKLFATEGNETVWEVGVGPKIPLGATDKTNNQGIALNADLQPGSGAWDGVVFTQFSRVLNFRPSMSILMTSTYGLKGKNKSYFGVQIYQFGNEWQLSAGVSDRVLLGKMVLDPSLLLQYRTQQPDRIDGEILPSTGGNWLFFNPSVAYWIQPNWSFNIGATLPIVSNITGVQVTPTYRFTTGFFYRLGNKSPQPIGIL
ncbi:MAG: transporter [Bacteroidota bacterium]